MPNFSVCPLFKHWPVPNGVTIAGQSQESELLKIRLAAVHAAIACVLGTMSVSTSAQTLSSLLVQSVPTHPKVKAAQASARAAGFDTDQAKAAWSPRVGLVADPGVTSGTGSSSAGDVGIRATKLVYDGGKTDAETTRQEARTKAAVFRIDAAVEQQAALVADLYLEALKQQQLTEEARKNVTAHADLVKRVSEIVDVDRGRKSDLDQANARLDQARVTLATRQAAFQEARAQLAATTLRSISAVSPAGQVAALMPRSEQEALALLDTHPQVLAAQADVDVARQASTIADAWRKPRIDVQGTLQRDATAASRRYLSAVDVRIVSNWTGFDGGSAEAAAASAREQMQASLELLDTTRRDLRVEVGRHWNAIATRADRHTAWEKLVTQLSSVRDNYWEQFKIGRRSILDLLNVENEIFQARTNAQTDLAETEQSRYRLLGATARLRDVFNLPSAAASK